MPQEPALHVPSQPTEPEFSPGQGFLSQLFAPVDIAFLVAFRIVFGATMLWYVWDHCARGLVEYYYITPRFHFTFYGFQWIHPWPGDGMWLHFYALGILALFLTVGFLYRISAILFFFGFTYVFLLEMSVYQNHYYLSCLIALILVFVPAHRCFSIDAWLRPALRSKVTPTWTLWLLRIQIGITYFYGGIAKINGDWLHAEPIRTWLSRRTGMPIIGPYLTEEPVVYFFAYGGLIFDLLVVPMLLWRRIRVIALLSAFLFHLFNASFWDIDFFPWFMMGATLVFLPPDWPRYLWRTAGKVPLKLEPISRLSIQQKVTVSVLGIYLAIQLLAPFRHYLYPGNSNWTEEAHHFAWRMMLREKNSAVRIYGTDVRTGRTGEVDVTPYITQRQVSRFGKNPDMILDLSHFLAREFSDTAQSDIEIRVLAMSSLNGRKPQLLFDPNLNLVDIERTWRSQPWISPLKEKLRQPAWDIPMHQWEEVLGIEPPSGQ